MLGCAGCAVRGCVFLIFKGLYFFRYDEFLDPKRCP